MEVVIVGSPAEGGRLAGDAVAALLSSRPEAVLGLATGSSPLPLYADLARRVDAGALSFSAARAFLLDEYVGLPAGHPQSYRSFIATELEAVVDFAPGAIQAPDVAIAGPGIQEACARFDAAIAAAGGVDLQILGIGTDGHIGFNEPGSSLGSRTRLKTLTAVTRSDNARFFAAPEDVPHHVVTQGIGTILEARHILLLAFGAAKAAAVAAAVEGPVSAMVPASALQLHPHATAVVDDDAAARLALADYYRETYAAKPSWQGL
jgi:glucosamine-6-phosphate deaminase